MNVPLVKRNFLFRGSSEEFLKDNKGNFLSMIQLLAKYDNVLDKLCNYLKVLQNIQIL